MLPKPPWPVIPLRANRLIIYADIQLGFSFCMWFNCDGVPRKHRPIPWQSFTGHTMILCGVNQSMVEPLFAIGNVFRYYSVALELDMQFHLSFARLLLGNQAHISLLCAMPVRSRFLHGLDFLAVTGQSFFQDLGLHTTELLLRNLLSVMPMCEICHWLSFTKDIVLIGNSPSTLICDTCGWYLQHWCEIAVRYCCIQWASDWSAPTALHQKQIQ
jgi:hypothetical protein